MHWTYWGHLILGKYSMKKNKEENETIVLDKETMDDIWATQQSFEE